MQQKISRLNTTLHKLGYHVSVESERVYLFGNNKKLAGSMTHEDFQIWAIEITAERAITEYIMEQAKLSRINTEISKVERSDLGLRDAIILNNKIREGL